MRYARISAVVLSLAAGAFADVNDVNVLEQSLRDVKDAEGQEKLVAAAFPGFKTSEEKEAFLQMGLSRYVYVVRPDVFTHYASLLLHDPDAAIRAKALGGLSRYEAVSYLHDIEAAAADADEKVRAAAALALHIGGLSELPRIREMVAGDKSPEVRARAILGIGIMARTVKSADDRERLLACIAGYLDEPDLHKAGVEAFWQARLTDKEPAYLDQLGRMSADEDKAVRLAALQAIADLHAASQGGAAAGRISDAEMDVRLQAITTLGTLKDPEHAGALVPLAQQGDLPTRLYAIAALGRIGDGKHAAVVAGCLTDSDSNIRRAAVTAVAALGRKEYFPAARKMLEDTDYMVRVAAVEAIPLMYEGKEAGATATRMLGDDDRSVKQTAVTVLLRLKAWDQRDAVEKALAREQDGAVHGVESDFIQRALKEAQ